ncbi:hypothetical protein NDU88_007995 [Pleurodeles waltl]|uniref:Uncharacterized protein n=1 Tax=Pleurodeles waltl TaxID=8319 RepID=A0AAV7VRA4_PLEWA|nr:hypothetical protein NDU88_007995 [Pleurodeles waltl]
MGVRTYGNREKPSEAAVPGLKLVSTERRLPQQASPTSECRVTSNSPILLVQARESGRPGSSFGKRRRANREKCTTRTPENVRAPQNKNQIPCSTRLRIYHLPIASPEICQRPAQSIGLIRIYLSDIFQG